MPTFPVVDTRRNVNGSWNLALLTESITVPSSSPYVTQLDEIPDNGVIETPPVIVGLDISQVYPPSNGTYYVNYATGELEFNSAQSGNTYIMTYWGMGTLVQAYHINKKATIEGTPDTGDFAIWYNSTTIVDSDDIDLGSF